MPERDQYRADAHSRLELFRVVLAAKVACLNAGGYVPDECCELRLVCCDSIECLLVGRALRFLSGSFAEDDEVRQMCKVH